MDTNYSLADISELNGECEPWHDDSDLSHQPSDDDHTEEASTSLGNRKEIRNSEKAKAYVDFQLAEYCELHSGH